MLKDLIFKNGFSQREIAEKVGVSLKTLNSYVCLRTEMPVSKAKKIAEILEVNWWELYERD